jgi:hypothetical protein
VLSGQPVLVEREAKKHLPQISHSTRLSFAHVTRHHVNNVLYVGFDVSHGAPFNGREDASPKGPLYLRRCLSLFEASPRHRSNNP